MAQDEPQDTAGPGDASAERQQADARERSPAQPTREDLENQVRHAEQQLAEAKAKLSAQDADREYQKKADGLRDEYASVEPALKAAQSTLQGYLSSQRKCLELDPAIKQGVDAIVAQERGDRGKYQRDVESKTTALTTAQRRLDDAKHARDDKAAAYQQLEKLAAGVRDRQSRAEAKRAEVKKALDAGEQARAYWLLSEEYAPLVSAAPAVMSPEELHKAIVDTGNQLFAAEAELRAAEAGVADVQAALDKSKSALADFDKGRDARIRDKLAAIKPTPAKDDTRNAA